MSIPEPTAGYPRTIYDAAGERIEVILDIATYEALLEALQDAEDIIAYDAAKALDEQPISWEQAKVELEAHRPELRNMSE